MAKFISIAEEHWRNARSLPFWLIISDALLHQRKLSVPCPAHTAHVRRSIELSPHLRQGHGLQRYWGAQQPPSHKWENYYKAKGRKNSKSFLLRGNGNHHCNKTVILTCYYGHSNSNVIITTFHFNNPYHCESWYRGDERQDAVHIFFLATNCFCCLGGRYSETSLL